MMPCLISLDDFSYLAFQTRDVLHDGFPNPIEVYGVIFMDKHISQPYDSTPWDLRVATTKTSVSLLAASPITSKRESPHPVFPMKP